MVQKVAGRTLPSSNWKTFSDNPVVNRYLYLNQGRIRQQKERDGLHLSFAVPKIQWDF